MFDWITGMVDGGGYAAVALLMFLENVFPPIPSELIMPLSGFVAAQGRLNIVLVLVAGSVGSLAGALFWYWIGLKVGSERLARFAQDHGRWLTLTPREVRAADDWFDRHGGKAVFLGRLIPGVRTLISVPAGVSGMRLGRFLLYSGLGTVLWTVLLTLAGWFLEDQYDRVGNWVGPVSNVVVAVLVLFYLYRVATFRRHVPKRGDPA
ncbi:MAG: DedA family protein [Geminicoccaceae bacterium]|nr:DedA family protein [Geminicoccaceae bacterium]